jgi:hypothetical protein
MSDPKRWDETGSDVDPVLRSVLRYAKGLGPEPAQVQRLLRRLEVSRKARRVSRLRGLVARRVWLAAAFLVMLGGVAFAGDWAGYALRSLQREWSAGAPARSVADPATVAKKARAGKVARRANGAEGSLGREPKGVDGAVASEPKGMDGAVASEPKGVDGAVASERKAEKLPVIPASRSDAMVRPRQKQPAVAARSSGPASAPEDAQMLQAARASMVADPNRALALTDEHASAFSGSPLTEERTALRIEALVGLGRSADAARELEKLELLYPRSPYRQRLRALITP